MADSEQWARLEFRQPPAELLRYGPTFHVGISSGPKKPMLKAVALLDTGASGSGISPALLSRLKVEPIDSGVIHEAGRDPITAGIYSVTLTLPGKPILDVDLEVAGLPSLAAPHDILLGRDILKGTRLSLDFLAGVTTLHIKTSG